MILLGRIGRLQVQTANLKVGTGVQQRYNNDPLRSIEQLEIDDGGVWGLQDGERIADIHHRDHPESKLRGTENSISFGFTGHYEAMRDRFGSQVIDGAAGENILIERQDIVELDDVAQGIFIERRDGRTLHMSGVRVAEPCAPFSRWALQFPVGARPDRRMTEALQFLSKGMRGFYCKYDGLPARLEIGDLVFAAV